MSPPDRVLAEPRFVAPFVAVAFAFSWCCWFPLLLAAQGAIDVQPPPVLQFVGALGPAIAGVVLSARTPAAWAQFRSRIRGPRAWLVAAVTVAVALCSVVPAGIVVTGIIAYGVGEELGWRGYLVPRLQRTRGSTWTSLAVAVVWAAWHLPLFAFAPAMLKMSGGDAIGWALSLVSASLLLTWFTNLTRGILGAVAFHGLFATVMTSTGSSHIPLVLGVVVMIAGFTLPFLYRAPKLTD